MQPTPTVTKDNNRKRICLWIPSLRRIRLRHSIAEKKKLLSCLSNVVEVSKGLSCWEMKMKDALQPLSFLPIQGDLRTLFLVSDLTNPKRLWSASQSGTTFPSCHSSTSPMPRTCHSPEDSIPLSTVFHVPFLHLRFVRPIQYLIFSVFCRLLELRNKWWYS